MGIATKKKYLVACLFALFIVAIVFQSVLYVYEKRSYFFARNYSSDYERIHFAYYNSQYVKKEKPGIITDETLESFSAGSFLRGTNPILIVHDQPPLGRYISALSILLFDNSHTITVPLIIISGIGLFLITQMVLQNIFFSLIPLAIFFNEPRFLSMFQYTPLLETIQFPFIVLALYFFMRGITQSKQYMKWFILASIMLGFVISIRFFVLGAVLLLAMISFFIIADRKLTDKSKVFITTLPISLLVLVLSYFKTLLDGYSVLQIFGIQKYILAYHQSKFILPFSFWDLLLFNKWHTWWDDRKILSDPQWIIMWPLATLLVMSLGISAMLKKIKLTQSELVLLLWCIFYSLSLSTGYTSTRYFLPLIPFLYILATSLVVRLIALRRRQ